MCQISHHYLSDTHYLSVSPIIIYQPHTPFHALHSHHYLHAFIALPHAPQFTHGTHLSRVAQLMLNDQKHRCEWETCTNLAPRALYQWRIHHNKQTLSAVSCQRSAVSCCSFCTRVHAFVTSQASVSHHYLHTF